MDWLTKYLITLPYLIIGTGLSLSYFLKFKDTWSIKILKTSSIINAFVSVIATAYLMFSPQKNVNIWVQNGLGITFQQDSLSLILLSMISILGMCILLFSINYLDGEKRRPIFLWRISIATMFAMLLVSSGNLALIFFAWIGTSISLNTLLLYYKNRLRAHAPARKKFILARLSDLFLLLAFWQLYTTFGTGQLAEIQSIILKGNFGIGDIKWAAICIAISGCLKSAQFPFHSWLIEVMESPTPVSALLHAGILNAGPFLVLRFSFLFASSEISSLILIIVGGITAIYASTVLLTQSAIKTIFGYSSAAHMGFTLFLCGIGAYSAALLHLIGHSFYKANTFLASGSTVQNTIKIGSISKLISNSSKTIAIISLFWGITIYVLTSLFFGNSVFNQQYWGVGVIVILGITLLISSGLRRDFFITRLLLISGLSAIICTLFFSFEHLIKEINEKTLSLTPKPSPLILMVYTTFICGYLLVTLFQISGHKIKRNTFLHKFYVHLRNGFYVNCYFDRLIGTYKFLNRKYH